MMSIKTYHSQLVLGTTQTPSASATQGMTSYLTHNDDVIPRVNDPDVTSPAAHRRHCVICILHFMSDTSPLVHTCPSPENF